MCCPAKLPFFIKNVPLNFTICYMYLYGIVPLNYHFPKKKKCPLKLHYLLYVFIWYCPLKLPFFKKNVPLNFKICYIYLYVLSP